MILLQKDERQEISFEGEEISLVQNSLSAAHFVLPLFVDLKPSVIAALIRHWAVC